jgi:hypothetical protein
MADRCITPEAQESYRSACRRKGMIGGALDCYKARTKLCPPPDVQPIVQVGADGINLLGVYQICQPKPVDLAPYPPSRPLPNEAAAQAAYARLGKQAQGQLSAVMALKRRAGQARKIDVGLGFWLGLGLCGVGAVALYARQK